MTKRATSTPKQLYEVKFTDAAGVEKIVRVLARTPEAALRKVKARAQSFSVQQIGGYIP